MQDETFEVNGKKTTVSGNIHSIEKAKNELDKVHELMRQIESNPKLSEAREICRRSQEDIERLKEIAADIRQTKKNLEDERWPESC